MLKPTNPASTQILSALEAMKKKFSVEGDRQVKTETIPVPNLVKFRAPG